MAQYQSRPYTDRSNQAYRTGFQLGSTLLDSATHMFPKNSEAFIAGLRKALSDQFQVDDSRFHPSTPVPQTETPPPPSGGSLREVNLALKNHKDDPPNRG